MAIEVDYRIITPRVSSGSRLTEAGPTPQIKSATILLKGVSAVGELPLLRADVGESSDAVMASGMATSSLAVSTGSAGNRPAEEPAQKSKQAIKREKRNKAMGAEEKAANWFRTQTKDIAPSFASCASSTRCSPMTTMIPTKVSGSRLP